MNEKTKKVEEEIIIDEPEEQNTEAEAETTPEAEETVVVVEPKEGVWPKIKRFGKKHSKKLVAGAAGLAIGVLGYMMGRNAGDGDDDCYVDSFDEKLLESGDSDTDKDDTDTDTVEIIDF